MAPGSRKRSLSDAPPTKRTTFEVLTTTSNPPAFIFILPFLFLPTLSESLYPLFSASPTSSITLPFHLFIAFIAFTSYALVPLPRIIRWELHWIMLGMALVTSQAVVGIWGESFITLGVNGGAWMARLAVEGPATVLRWWCFMKMVGAKEQVSFSRHMGCKSLLRELTNGIIHFAERQKRSMRTLSVLAIVTYIASGYQPPSFYLVPECYILQAHGLLLIVAATTLSSLFPPLRTPLSSRSLQSLPAIFRPLLLALTLTLALLTSTTTSHCPLSPVSSILLPHQNSTSPILASKKSLTGWITVGETESEGHVFRYLRADHSILGGLWVGPARKEVVKRMLELKVSMWDDVDENAVVGTAESIYSTFIMQEIARFAGVPEKQMAKSEKALIIGLGAGLAARSFEMHSVNTSIVEIDPVVYDYATKYFGVGKPSGGVYLEDAKAFLERPSSVKYDYIIHDVFTGGSVPSSLFTTEFWSLTSRSLLPTGIVAVNFAGNITSLSSHLVLHTLLSSFPHCRAWEDGPPSGDFRNIVLLCSPNKERKVRMRNPVPVDFLPYPSPRIRKRVFETYKEFEIDLRGTDRTVPILGEKNKGILDRTLVSGAKEHWGIMKKVLRDEVWAKW